MKCIYKRRLTKEEQRVELHLISGNHQLAKLKPERLEEKIGGDMELAFAIPIDKSAVEKSLVL